MEARTSQAPPGGHRAVLRGSSAQRPSRRRLRLSADDRLVARIRGGSEEAFAALWERYQGPLLSYCRHMLGSHEEAEDAVQQVFINAHRALARDDDRDVAVRPWLYRIARNQCLDVLRARRPAEELAEDEQSVVGLSEEVAGRAELRDLLRDLARLPIDQREALLLAELHDNSHADVAEILGCERDKVKSLVFQARSSLMKSRQAREISCGEVQEQLSVLRGGSLRRSVLRRHLVECDACRLFADEVKRQRAGLAVVLPVAPVGALKLGAGTAFAASAASSAASAGTAGIGAGGIAGVAAKLGVPTAVLKGAVATVAVTTVAAGSAATVKVAEHPTRGPAPKTNATEPPAGPAAPAAAAGQPGARTLTAPGRRARARARTRARDRRAGTPGVRERGAQRDRLRPAARTPGRRGPQKARAERTRQKPARARKPAKPKRTVPLRPAPKERPAKPAREVPTTPELPAEPLPEPSG